MDTLLKGAFGGGIGLIISLHFDGNILFPNKGDYPLFWNLALTLLFFFIFAFLSS